MPASLTTIHKSLAHARREASLAIPIHARPVSPSSGKCENNNIPNAAM